MDGVMSNDDLAIEVLSRLSTKDIAIAKCVSRRWNNVISSNDFLCAHSSSHAKELCGFFLENINLMRCEYYPAKEEEDKLEYNTSDDERDDEGEYVEPPGLHVDFLPEKVNIMASSNGLLCCRSCLPVDREKGRRRNRSGKEVLYICNPLSKEWFALKQPKELEATRYSVGLNFCVSNNVGSRITLVSIQSSIGDQNAYTFWVYSSETSRWRASNEVCYCEHKIHEKPPVFVGSKCHWLTIGHQLISFDIEKEHSMVLKLPGPKAMPKRMLFGSSEGCLHYLSFTCGCVIVWMLNDKFEWLPKYGFRLLDFISKQGFKVVTSNIGDEDLQDDKTSPVCFLGFHDDVLYFYLLRQVYAYNFKIKRTIWQGGGHLFDGSLTNTSLFVYTLDLASVSIVTSMRREIDSNSGRSDAFANVKFQMRRKRKRRSNFSCTFP